MNHLIDDGVLDSSNIGIFVLDSKFRTAWINPPQGGQEERWLKYWSQPIRTGINAGGRIEHHTDIS